MSWYGTVISSREGDTLVASDRPAAVWIIAGVLLLAGSVFIAALFVGAAKGSWVVSQIARGVGAAITITCGVLLAAHAPLTRFVFPRRGRAMSISRFWARGPETLLLERKEIDTIAVEEQVEADDKRWHWLSIRLRNGNVIRMTAQGMPASQLESLELVAEELRRWWSLPEPRALPPFGAHTGFFVPATARRAPEPEPAAVSCEGAGQRAPRPASPTPASTRLRLIG